MFIFPGFVAACVHMTSCSVYDVTLAYHMQAVSSLKVTTDQLAMEIVRRRIITTYRMEFPVKTIRRTVISREKEKYRRDGVKK